MALVHSIESAIHQQLARADTCSLNELTAVLPGYSWAQVFAAVDRLTREGTVVLTHPAPCRDQLGDSVSEYRARIDVGLFYAMTLRQNRRQFHAVDHARNAA